MRNLRRRDGYTTPQPYTRKVRTHDEGPHEDGDQVGHDVFDRVGIYANY